MTVPDFSMSHMKCSVCGSNKTDIRKDTKREVWRHSKLTGDLLCRNCYFKERYSIPEIREKKLAYYKEWVLKNREKYLAYMREYNRRRKVKK